MTKRLRRLLRTVRRRKRSERDAAVLVWYDTIIATRLAAIEARPAAMTPAERVIYGEISAQLEQTYRIVGHHPGYLLKGTVL